MRLAIVPVVAALALSSCSGPIAPVSAAPSVVSSPGDPTVTPDGTPTEAPAPNATGTPDPTPSQVTLVPPSDLQRVAVVERDGVRMTLELERNPMPAGEPTTLTATVRNVGRDVLTWFHDGCAITVSTQGGMAVPWRLGVHHTGAAETFKGRVLGYSAGPSPLPGPIIDFVPEKYAGKGSFGCADIGLSDRIAPGKAITQRSVWDGQANFRSGPPPSGPVTLTGTFAFFWRGTTEPETVMDRKLDVTLDAWITGDDGPRLSPPEVVDAALADPAFVDYLVKQDPNGGWDGILWYRPELGAWEVGALNWYDAATPRLHLLHIDPYTGEVLRTVDRPWDQRLDGFP